ncbi:MAG: MFS transporter [Gammaproteobacteria bacterium]|nr:MFS transporter [Gammaproteobacteria bacterium]
MYKTVRTIWPLFFGLLLLALAIGVQNSLLGLRASIEGFDITVTGFVMSGYFIGFLFGSTQGAKIIKRVGHVRAFGALTALASVSVIVHAVFVLPSVWFVMRVITGLAMSGIYVVAESWLNHAANDKNRGQILSIYMIIMMLGSFAGQFLLNLADPESFELFGLISILVSFAAIPILITVTPTPKIEQTSPVSIRKLFQWTSFGVIGIFIVNICDAMLFGMAAVYAATIGLSVLEISYFVAAFIFGGLVLQWPIGFLSDRIDRTIVITIVSAAATISAYFCTLQSKNDMPLLLLFTALLGGFLLPLYALFIAFANDYMRPEKIVAASSTIILVGGMGATTGPLISALMMDTIGAQGFFWGIGMLCAIVCCLGAYSVLFHKYIPEEDRHEFSIYAGYAVAPVAHAELGTDDTEDSK